MADIDKVIKGLQIERECVSRDCDRNCGQCDLVQDRDWLLSVALSEGQKQVQSLLSSGRELEEIINILKGEIDRLKAGQPKWISVSERLPENAQHKGAHCPRYKVYTKWGETEGWYNPDKGCWYFLLWYFDGEKVDFEHGDNPKLAHEINGAKVVTHWMPLSEPPKEGEA